MSTASACKCIWVEVHCIQEQVGSSEKRRIGLRCLGEFHREVAAAEPSFIS